MPVCAGKVPVVVLLVDVDPCCIVEPQVPGVSECKHKIRDELEQTLSHVQHARVHNPCSREKVRFPIAL
jgi:hypothetical protein